MSYMGGFIAIDVCVLNDHFCANAHVILAKIGTSIRHTLNDNLAHKWSMQAEVDKAWTGSSYLCNAWYLHIAQHLNKSLGYWQRITWAIKLVLAYPFHNRHRIIAKASLCRKA